jgi:hypothetical protein
MSNPCNMPYLTIGNTYEILSNHPTREDYFCLLSDGNTRAFYKKSWFENES